MTSTTDPADLDVPLSACPAWCTSYDRDPGDGDPTEVRHLATAGGWLEAVRWDAADAGSDTLISIHVGALEDRLGVGGREPPARGADVLALAGELITAAALVEPLDAWRR